MKHNEKRCHFFIILVIVTCISGIFSYQEVNAKKDCNFTKNRKCDFRFDNFLFFGGKRCDGLNPTIVYVIPTDNTGKNNEYGFCYYDPNLGGFFYEVVAENCNNTQSLAFIDCGSNVVSKTTAEAVRIIPPEKKLTKEMGCAQWVYYNNYDGSVTFSYVKLEGYKFYQEEQQRQSYDQANGVKGADREGSNKGQIVDDNGQTLEKIKACVGSAVGTGNYCTDDGKPKSTDTLLKDCVKNNTVDFTDSLYEKYKPELEKYYREQGYAQTITYICRLTKKCNAKTLEILTYIDNKNKYRVKSEKALIEESFSSNVQMCVKEELIEKAPEVKTDIDKTQTDIDNGIESGIDASKEQRNIDFQNNNQNNYVGERLHIVDYGKINSSGDCAALLSDETTKLFNTVLRYMQYLGPVLVVVLSTMDFIKAAASGNPDDMKKAWNKLVKRLIAAILLFFVALITRLLLSFFDITVPENCIK